MKPDRPATATRSVAADSEGLRGIGALPEAGGGAGPVLSNRLAHLAGEARTAARTYRRSSAQAMAAYVAAGKVLAEARESARRGEWSAVLAVAGVEERTALNMMRLARGGWTGETVTAAGGVRVALDVEAWRGRLADGAAVAGPPAAVAGLAGGPAKFVAYCEGAGEAPADVVAGLAAPGADGEKPETVSGNDDAPAFRNAGEGKWNPARPSSNEWYSPSWIVEPARTVLGGFDLDPASCAEANETIRAARYFTANDDGMAQPWRGRVWCNPPYSDRDLVRWVTKLVEAFDSGDVPEAVMLLPAYTETKMSQTALARCKAVCFPARRVQFNRPGLPATNPPAASMLVYFGARVERFRAAYSDRGLVLPGGWAWPAAA